MGSPQPGAGTARVAAATVLYRPDPVVLDALLAPLEADGVPLFIFLNGPVEPAIATRLAASGAVILEAPVNLGLGHGLNAVAQAAADAGYTFVALFDQDSAPPRGLVAALVAGFAQLPATAAALGPRLVAPAGEHYLAPWYARRGAARPAITPVDFLPTSGTLLSLARWRAVGPFRADYFIDGIDVEWCFRAWSQGHGCHLAETVTMVHRWGDATREADRKPQILRQSLTRSFYYLRNAAYGLRLPHMPVRWRLRHGPRIAAQAGLLLLAGPLRRGVWKTVSTALADGLRGRLGPIPPGLGDRRPGG